MHQIGYYLDEDKNWSLDMDVLEKAYQDATEVCNPRYFGLIFILNFIQFYSILLNLLNLTHFYSTLLNFTQLYPIIYFLFRNCLNN